MCKLPPVLQICRMLTKTARFRRASLPDFWWDLWIDMPCFSFNPSALIVWRRDGRSETLGRSTSAMISWRSTHQENNGDAVGKKCARPRSSELPPKRTSPSSFLLFFPRSRSKLMTRSSIQSSSTVSCWPQCKRSILSRPKIRCYRKSLRERAMPMSRIPWRSVPTSIATSVVDWWALFLKWPKSKRLLFQNHMPSSMRKNGMEGGFLIVWASLCSSIFLFLNSLFLHLRCLCLCKVHDSYHVPA